MKVNHLMILCVPCHLQIAAPKRAWANITKFAWAWLHDPLHNDPGLNLCWCRRLGGINHRPITCNNWIQHFVVVVVFGRVIFPICHKMGQPQQKRWTWRCDHHCWRPIVRGSWENASDDAKQNGSCHRHAPRVASMQSKAQSKKKLNPKHFSRVGKVRSVQTLALLPPWVSRCFDCSESIWPQKTNLNKRKGQFLSW